MKKMKESGERGSLEEKEHKQRDTITAEAREEILFLFITEQGARSLLGERRVLERKHLARNRKELDDFVRLESESRSLVATEEATMRSTVSLPHLCALQIDFAALKQQQQVSEAIKQLRSMADAQRSSNGDEEKERMAAVANRLDGIEHALAATLQAAANDPTENWYYKTRQISREETSARDFIEDLQLSLRRELVQMCCAAALSPFSSMMKHNSPTRNLAPHSPSRTRYIDANDSSILATAAHYTPPGSSSPAGNAGEKWAKVLRDIFTIDMSFGAAQGARYAALFAENGFLACVDGAVDAERVRETLITVLGEITTEELLEMGISTVGERRALLTQLKQLSVPRERSSSVANSDNHSSIARGRTAAAMTPGGVARGASAASSPNSASLIGLHDPAESFEEAAKESPALGLQAYAKAVRKLLRSQDSSMQREWEALRRQAYSPSVRRRATQEEVDNLDVQWEAQWRQACIADMQREAGWEADCSKLMDRCQAGLSVTVEDLPIVPFENRSTDESIRMKLLKFRKAGL